MKYSKPFIFCGIAIYICATVLLLRFFTFVNPLEFGSILVEKRKEGRLINYIENNYYLDVEREDLLEGRYKGIVSTLGDKYSEYYTAEEYLAYNNNLQRQFGGIGATLTKDEQTGLVSVTDLTKDSPAQKGGLEVGDIIISADGNIGKVMELTDFVNCIRGDVGTTVELKVLRGEQELLFNLKREYIHLPTIAYQMMADTIGYIAISNFTLETGNEFKAALTDLESQGATSMIFDLRDNPGGYLDTAVEMVDYLLPECLVVYLEDKNGNRHDYMSDEKNQKNYDCVLLVNGNTASSSEIFSGALRDHDYATIIGTTTFGKGIVQNFFPLGDGSGAKITTSQYFTPDGNQIQGIGITPDIEIEYEYSGSPNEAYDYSKDNQVQKAIEILEKN